MVAAAAALLRCLTRSADPGDLGHRRDRDDEIGFRRLIRRQGRPAAPAGTPGLFCMERARRIPN
jgi:hypothetical protein